MHQATSFPVMQVSELAGYAVEQVAYSHGQKSAEDLIIAMAQGFVGSNNINLLEPNCGPFGTRNEVRSQTKGKVGCSFLVRAIIYILLR